MSNEISTKTVTFLYDGETVATVETPVGEFPTVPEIGAKKEGYRLMWLGSDKAVEEDTVCVAYEVLGNPTQLLYSLSSPLLAYPADKADNQGNVFASSMCILYLTAEVRHNPENEIFRARVVEHLKHFVNPENNVAPYFDLSCNWPYALDGGDHALPRDARDLE